MLIERRSDPRCFQNLVAEWQKLLPLSVDDQIFTTSYFQNAWWESFGEGELNVITVRNDAKKLTGIFPFYKVGSGLHVLASKEVTDYFDFIVEIRNSKQIYAGVVNELEKFSWKSLTILSLPQASPTLKDFAKLLEKKGWKVEKVQQNVCPIITLPKTWDEYLTSIGRKQRHEIRRKWKNLEAKTHPKFVVIETEKNINQAIKDFLRLHKSSSTEKAGFWNPAQEKYFSLIMKAAAREGWLKLYFLEIDGVRSASMVCFDYNNIFYLYNSGYDPAQFAGLSVGNVLTAYTIKHAIELGRSKYDFLRGDEEYKLRFRAVAEPIFDLKVSRV